MRLVGVAAILWAATAYAESSPKQGACGSYYGSIEALYWKPCFYPTLVATLSSNGSSPVPVSTQTVAYLEGRYDTGGRARLGYEVCDWFFDVGGLYYRGDDHTKESTASWKGVFTPFFSVISMTADMVLKYWNVDARAGRLLFERRWWDTYLYANARWVNLSIRNTLNGFANAPLGAPVFMKQKGEFKGGGLGLGLGGHVYAWRGLGLTYSAGGMIIYGETSSVDFSTRQPDGQRIVPYKPLIRHGTIPAVNARFGIDYTLCLRCWQLNAEVGWELDHYFNVLPTSISGLNQQLVYNDMGFSGPYFNLGAKF